MLIQEMMREEEKIVRSMEQYVQDEQRKGNFPSYFNFPLSMQFDLTGKCNLKCQHCFNDSRTDANDEENMTADRWLELAGQIIAEGGVFSACFSGGEPFLKKELLLEMLGLFGQDGANLSVITNGYLLNEKTVLDLKKFPRLKLRISIDGHTEDLHDALRQVPGSFQRAVKAARLMASHGVMFEISSCVTPANLESMEQMVKLAHELGALNIVFDMLVASGRAAKNRHLLFDLTQVGAFFAQLKALRQKYDDVLPAYTGTIMVQSLLSALPNENLLLRPNGDVRLACLAPFVIGNVMEEEIGEIWRKKGVIAWQHPTVRGYLHNADLISGENKGFVNYLDKDIRLDFDSFKRKNEVPGKAQPSQYKTPSVVHYAGLSAGGDRAYDNNEKQDSWLSSKRAKGTAVKTREDRNHLLVKSEDATYIMNMPGRMSYRLMDGNRTIEEIVKEISSGFSIGEETVKADIASFCRKLADFRLVKI